MTSTPIYQPNQPNLLLPKGVKLTSDGVLDAKQLFYSKRLEVAKRREKGFLRQSGSEELPPLLAPHVPCKTTRALLLTRPTYVWPERNAAIGVVLFMPLPAPLSEQGLRATYAWVRRVNRILKRSTHGSRPVAPWEFRLAKDVPAEMEWDFRFPHLSLLQAIDVAYPDPSQGRTAILAAIDSGTYIYQPTTAAILAARS